MNNAVIAAIVRYVIMTIAGALAAHGHLSSDANSYISSNVDTLIGAGVALLTWAEGLIATHKLSTAAASAPAKPSITPNTLGGGNR